MYIMFISSITQFFYVIFQPFYFFYPLNDEQYDAVFKIFSTKEWQVFEKATWKNVPSLIIRYHSDAKT